MINRPQIIKEDKDLGICLLRFRGKFILFKNYHIYAHLEDLAGAKFSYNNLEKDLLTKKENVV